jgi:hypothetical protein
MCRRCKGRMIRTRHRDLLAQTENLAVLHGDFSFILAHKRRFILVREALGLVCRLRIRGIVFSHGLAACILGVTLVNFLVVVDNQQGTHGAADQDVARACRTVREGGGDGRTGESDRKCEGGQRSFDHSLLLIPSGLAWERDRAHTATSTRLLAEPRMNPAHRERNPDLTPTALLRGIPRSRSPDW